MPAGDILRNWLEKRKARWWEESMEEGIRRGREEGLVEGIRLGREEGIRLGREEGRRLGREAILREVYGPDHTDSPNSNHPQPPDANNGDRQPD